MRDSSRTAAVLAFAVLPALGTPVPGTSVLAAEPLGPGVTGEYPTIESAAPLPFAGSVPVPSSAGAVQTLVGEVRIVGLEELPEPVRLPLLPLRSGAPYTFQRVAATERAILAALAEAGYPFAALEVEAGPVDARGLIDVQIEVDPGPLAEFGEITVIAAAPLTEAQVRERIAFAPGERFRSSALDRTAERLYRLPIVDRVVIDPRALPGRPGTVSVIVDVTTRRVAGVQLQGAVSSADCLEGALGWSTRYLFGAPGVLTLSGGAANLLARPLRRFPCTRVAEAEFEEPDYFVRGDLRLPLGADSWLLVGGSVRRESAPHQFIRQGVIGRLGIGREIVRGLEASATVSADWGDNPAAGPIFCGVYGLCSPDELVPFTRNVRIVPLEVGATWAPPAGRAPPLGGLGPPTPLAGPWRYGARAALQGSGRPILSDVTFVRLDAEASLGRALGSGFELAARVRGGVLAQGDDPVPPQFRLFGGGPFGVRGVAPNLLGPRVLTATPERILELGCEPIPGGCEGIVVGPRTLFVRPTGGSGILEASLEARQGVARWLQVAAFVDAGLVSTRSEARGRSIEGVVTPGVGAFAITPFGPIRLDVAFDPRAPRRYPLLARTGPDEAFIDAGRVVYDPFGFDDPGPAREFRRRLQFQFSMRQPF